jgi:threonine/homoserine/homoserine lactone efflux protein
LLAVLGVSWLVEEIDGLMTGLRYFAAGFFLFLGYGLIRKSGDLVPADSRLTRPGVWAGFIAGVAVILGNPKAILFYMGLLPGFFDLTAVTPKDILAIVLISMAVPFFGNLAFAAMIARARALLTTPNAIARLNKFAGGLLVLVGLFLGATAHL